MAKSVGKQIADQAFHVLYTVIALGPIAASPLAFAPLTFGWAGFCLAVYREDGQHRPTEGWGWMTTSWGRWLDIASATLAGMLLGLPAMLVGGGF